MQRTALAAILAPAFFATLAPSQAGWSRLYPTQSPPGRSEALMSCREATGDVLLLFGIFNYSGGVWNDGWLFDGSNWTQLAGTLPPVRSDSAMVYDAAHDRVVLFGGRASGSALQDTWLWNGSTWTNPNPSLRPSARAAHSMAYDRKRGVTVLFSGGPGSTALSDLWEWNGSAWSDRTPLVSAPAGLHLTMAFDPSLQAVLLYTGECWSWDGTTWQRRQPVLSPAGASFVADLHRRRVVMPFGNRDSFTWEWNGTNWDIRLQGSPFYRDSAAVAYDPTRRRVVLVGGAFNADTWVYGTPNPAGAVSYGTGCAGSAGVPLLVNAPYSLPWLGDTFTTSVASLAPTSSIAVFATGVASTSPVDLTPFGMPGCYGLVAVAASDFSLATAGAAQWSVTVPNRASLNGVHIYQQAFVLEAGVNAAGVIASNGLDVVVGIR